MRMRLGVIGILSLVVLLSAGCGAPGARRLSLIRAEGTRFVDESGKEVLLFGPNLGCWMIQEPWMIKLDNQPGIDASKDIWDTLEKRFGADKAQDLYRIYMDNFVTEDDIAYIASLGCNMVRVPFWYAALTDPKYNGGAECLYMDRVVDWCRKHGIYVLIDMHGAPGGQNTDIRILGDPINNKMWSNPQYVDRAAAIWRRVAERYRGEKVVLGYDLLNEPWGAPSLPRSMKDMVDVYDRLYREIRAVDPDHMIFIEDGLQNIARLPHPAEMGWKNVAYSFHCYPDSREKDGVRNTYSEYLPNMRRAQIYFNVPLHLGEFNSMTLEGGGAAAMRRYYEVCRRYGWAWNMWNYKKIEDWSEINWGMVGTVHDYKPVDLAKSSFDEIRAAFENYNTARVEKNLCMEGALADFVQSLKHPDSRVLRDDLILYPEEGMLSRGRRGGLRVEWGTPVVHFNWWGTGDCVLWRVNAPVSGVYDVVLDYAYDSDTATPRPLGEIEIDGHRFLEFPVVSSKGWQNFRRATVGAVKLEKGDHRLRLLARVADKGFLNLRSVELVPASTPGASGPDYRLTTLSPLAPGRMTPVRHDVNVEWQMSPGNIGHWRDSECVSWEFDSDRDGISQVSFDFATPNFGSQMEITANGGEKIVANLPRTGEWHKYERVEAGQLRFRKGRNTITLRMVTPVAEGGGNVGEIFIEQVAP